MSGTTLGSYELRDEISRETAGVTHLAWDSQEERDVAVQLLPVTLGSARNRRRFQEEVERRTRIEHPHVARVYTWGETPEGIPYVVMEPLEGLTLQDVLELEGPLPADYAAELVSKVARGLAAAHREGLLHRDLTPSSVVLDDQGEPFLTDFGIVRELGAREDVAIRIKGRFLGSAGYLSPEQAREELDAIGPHTDVFGLGALLFALLTGRPPSSARTLIEAVDALQEQPQRPSQLQAGVPAELEAICLRCLAKAPKDRYAGPGLLADALDAWRQGPEPEPEPEPPPSPVRRWGRILVGWALVALLSLPAAWGVGRWRLARSRDLVREREQAAVELAGSPEARASAARGLLARDPEAGLAAAGAVTRDAPRCARGWSVLALAQHLTGADAAAVETLGRALQLSPERLEDRLLRAQLFLELGKPTSAREDARVALGLNRASARARELLARAALALDDPEGARDQALALTEQDPGDPDGWELLARARLALGDLEGALGAATRLRQSAPARGRAMLERIRQAR